MAAVSIYDGTPRHIVGVESINEWELRYRLGHRSWVVWWCATTLRDKRTGELEDTDDLKRMANVNDRQLKRCFVQLRRFGLISPAVRRVECIRGKMRVLYVRKVYGQTGPGFSGTAGIPANTAGTLAKTLGRGGARSSVEPRQCRKLPPGYGKASVVVGEHELLPWYIHENRVVAGGVFIDPDLCPAVVEGESKMGTTPPVTDANDQRESPKKTDGTEPALILSSSSLSFSSSFHSEEKAPASGAPNSFSNESKTLPLSQRHPVSMGAQHPLVPRQVFVSHEVALRIPDPPKDLSKDLPGRRAYLLQRWLEEAWLNRTGKKYWGFRAEKVGHITQSKHYASMLRACDVLAEFGISPAAWVAWSVNIWIGYSKQGKRPVPVAWVFAENRIREREGWFRSEQQDYAGGRLVYTHRAREFMRAQEHMRREFSGLSKDCSDAEILSIVAKYFPRGFDHEFAGLKGERDVLERELLERLMCGDWIWNRRARVEDGQWVWR